MLTRRTFLGTATAASLAPALLSADKPKFKLGLVTYNVPKDWDLPTLLRICKQTGIAAVEARTTHKHGIEPTLNSNGRKKIKKQFADAGVVFWGCGSVCEFHSPDRNIVRKNIDDCKAFCQLTADLGGRGVKVRPNGVDKSMTVEQACAQIGRALTECGKAAGDLGIEIWVEVHGPVTQIPKNMKLIMDTCGNNTVGVTWNSNSTDVVDNSISQSFELLKDHIKSCHINDLENDAKGKYPYRDLFKRLKENQYDRYTLIEVGKAYDPKAGEVFLKKYAARWQELVS